ncbi:hypothetical protein ABIF78_001364 [Bradyrhizobium japonicum]
MPAVGRHRRQHGARDVEEIDAAAADLGQEIGVRAELRGGKELDLQPAAARFPDPLHGLIEAGVDRLGQRLAGGELVFELRGLRRPGADRDQWNGRSRHHEIAA